MYITLRQSLHIGHLTNQKQHNKIQQDTTIVNSLHLQLQTLFKMKTHSVLALITIVGGLVQALPNNIAARDRDGGKSYGF